MRESIGTISLLNFVIFFIFLVFAFLVGTFSYYKAYKVNNYILSAIEKYEGFNSYSIKEIDDRLNSLSYQRVSFSCPQTRGKDAKGKLMNTNGNYSGDGTGNTVNSGNRGYSGYCIYVYNNDSKIDKPTDVYDTYEVMTVITFQFPIVQDLLKLRVTSRSGLIYNFEASRKAMEV